MEEIVNRVSQSKLRTVDPEDYYVPGSRMGFDISGWLLEGLVLVEKEFRAQAEAHNWEIYKDSYVWVYCSTDAVVPAWAYMFIASKLSLQAKRVVQGDRELLETLLFEEAIRDADFSEFQDKPVILKGCFDKPIPPNAYLLLLHKLQPLVSSLMYGEACSAVPVFKKSIRK